MTLRIYLPASQVAGISFTVAYPVIAWLCWVPNLLLALLFLRSRHARDMLTASILPPAWQGSRERIRP